MTEILFNHDQFPSLPKINGMEQESSGACSRWLPQEWKRTYFFPVWVHLLSFIEKAASQERMLNTVKNPTYTCVWRKRLCLHKFSLEITHAAGEWKAEVAEPWRTREEMEGVWGRLRGRRECFRGMNGIIQKPRLPCLALCCFTNVQLLKMPSEI